MDDVYLEEKRKWNEYSYGKTIPSLQAYPQKIASKNGIGFLFLVSPLYFSIFLPIFSPFFLIFFYKKLGYL